MGACKAKFSFDSKNLPSINIIISKLEDRINSDLAIEYVGDYGCIIEHEALSEEISLDINIEKQIISIYIAFFTEGSSGFLTTQSEYIVYSATKTDMDYMNGIEVIEFEKLDDNWYYAKTEEDMY